MKYVAAIDVGGTSMKAALVSEKFEVIATKNSPTPKDDPTGIEIARTIATIVGELSASKLVSAVGFAVPGTLDEERGISRWTGNLGWKDLPIRELVEREVQRRPELLIPHHGASAGSIGCAIMALDLLSKESAR